MAEQYSEEAYVPGSFLDSLRDFMDNEIIEEMGITDDAPVLVKSKEHANYLVKRLNEIHEQQKEINDFAKREIERTKEKIERWKEAELRKTQGVEDYFTNMLKDYAQCELANSNGKTKSIKLPFGSIGFKKQPALYEYDDKAILESVQNNEALKAYVSYVPNVNKAELRKSGEVIDGKLFIGGKPVEGVTVTPREEKFEVK